MTPPRLQRGQMSHWHNLMAELTTSRAPPDRTDTLRMDTLTRDEWQDRAQAAGLHVAGFAGPVRGRWIPYLYSCGCPA